MDKIENEKTEKDSTAKRKKIDPRRLGREFAMQYLFQCEHCEEGEDCLSSLPTFWLQIEELKKFRQNKYYRKAKEFAERLIQTTLREKKVIDEKIAKFAKNWRIERMGAVDRNIMRIAVAEMLFFEDIPPIVSINEAVETAKIYGSESSGAFVNGILNSIKNDINRDPRIAKKTK